MALLTSTEIYVANAGDSRAVISQGGKIFSLSKDHKTTMPDEMARIKKCGGKIS